MNTVLPACSVQIALCDVIRIQKQKKTMRLAVWSTHSLTLSLKHWFKMSCQLWNWCVTGNDIKENENTLKVVRNKETGGTELVNTEGTSTHAQPRSSQAGCAGGSCYHGTDDQLSLRGQRSADQLTSTCGLRWSAVCITDRFFLFLFSQVVVMREPPVDDAHA